MVVGKHLLAVACKRYLGLVHHLWSTSYFSASHAVVNFGRRPLSDTTAFPGRCRVNGQQRSRNAHSPSSSWDRASCSSPAAGPRPSGNRSLKSPWPAPDTRQSRDKIQTGCSPCHSCSCSHSRSGFRPRCGGTGRRGSTCWCTPSHTCLGASGDNPKTGKRGRWGWGRHTPLFKEEERQWAVAPVAASVQGWCGRVLGNFTAPLSCCPHQANGHRVLSDSPFST